MLCTGLDLNGAKGFAPSALAQALLALPSLRSLVLNGMRFPGAQLDDVLRQLADGSDAALEHLDLNNSSVTSGAVDALRARWPACDVTTVNCNNV
jgi:hypothetical protein